MKESLHTMQKLMNDEGKIAMLTAEIVVFATFMHQ